MRKNKWKKETCGNANFLCFQTKRTKKIFTWTESHGSSFLPRNEAAGVNTGYEKWKEKEEKFSNEIHIGSFWDENLDCSFYVNLNLKNKF